MDKVAQLWTVVASIGTIVDVLLTGGNHHVLQF